MRPVCRAKLPEHETTCSQAMSPLSVLTSQSPEGRRSIPMTVVLRFDLTATRPCAAGEGLGEIGRLDVAVLGMLQRAQDAVRVAQRPDLLHLLGGQQLDLDAADRLRDAGIVAVLVEPVGGAGEADVGHRPETDRLPRLGLERAVEVDRIFVDLTDRVAHVEQRQQAGRVPGRTGCQFLALDEDAVRPALLHEMVPASTRRPQPPPITTTRAWLLILSPPRSGAQHRGRRRPRLTMRRHRLSSKRRPARRGTRQTRVGQGRRAGRLWLTLQQAR